MFIEEYLQDLRAARFAPRAIVQYVRRAFGRVREDWVANPGAVRSVWSVALGFFVAAFLGAAAIAIGHDRQLAYDFFVHTSLWGLPAFGVLTLHLGLLRNRDGHRLSAMNVPTVLTMLRVVLIPGIILCLVERAFLIGLGLFIAAAVSDVLDGWLARRTGQVTRLGVVLDPIVDIVFNLSMFGGLTFAGLLPIWVFALACLRYGILLVGGASLYLFVGPVRIHPTGLGRFTGVIMAVLVSLLVLLVTLPGDLAARLQPITEIALGGVVALTLGQVIVLGWYNVRTMTGEVEARGRVVGDVRWDGR